MYSTLIIVPTYNEARNLWKLIPLLREIVPSADILIIDDNSPDGTGRIADELSRNIRGVLVRHRPHKLGIGSAHLLGLSLAIESGYEVAVTMDADLTHDPRSVPELLTALDQSRSDIAVGSRYRHKNGIGDWSLARRLITRIAHLCTTLFLGLPFDATGGLRAYRVTAIARVDCDAIKSDGYSFLFEMLFRCHRQGLRIVEVPVVLSLRQAGASKISRVEIFRALAALARLTIVRACGIPTPGTAKTVEKGRFPA